MTLPVWERSAPLGTRTPQQIMADVHTLHAARAEAEAVDRGGFPPPEKFAEPTRDLPRAAKKYARMCEGWGATAARGPVTARNDQGWRMADSIVLKGRVGQRRFVALFLEQARPTSTGKKAMSMAFAYAHNVGRVDAGMLTRYLTQDDDIPWLPGVDFLSRTTH